MSKEKTIFGVAMLLVMFVAGADPADGQHIYNKSRDEQAQKALPLADALKNGEIFNRQLKNLGSLAKRDFETEFLVTKFQINAFSMNLLTWGDAHDRVCQTEAINTDSGNMPSPDEIQAALAELKAAIKTAKDSLTAFKTAAKLKEEKDGGDEDEEKGGSALTTLFNRLGDLESLQEFAEKTAAGHPGLINTKTVAAITEITEIMQTLKKVYDAYTARVEEFNKLSGQLAELRVVLKKVAIQSLQVDEEHWKNIAAIRARRETDRADLLALVSEYKGIVRRLMLVDFGSDPKDFCNAVRIAGNIPDGIDIRPRQVITENLKEIVARARSLEQDNQNVLSKARTALLQVTGRPASDPRGAVQDTITALTQSIDRINSGQILNKLEEAIRDGDRKIDATDLGLIGDRDALRAAANPASTERALRFAIIHAQKNTVRTRDMVADVPQALYVLAALIARGSTPNKLADVRLAQELHAYSIRKSAVRARAYELTVSTGAQRLALFHKGGIKPTDVAQLVFAASNIAISPAVLAR